MQQATVYRNAQPVGILSRDDAGEYCFVYDAVYLENKEALSISVHFPLRHEPFRSKVLFPFFFNLLAEGVVKEMQCRQLQIDPDDPFTRLIKTTRSNTIGSITLEERDDAMS